MSSIQTGLAIDVRKNPLHVLRRKRLRKLLRPFERWILIFVAYMIQIEYSIWNLDLSEIVDFIVANSSDFGSSVKASFTER